MSYAAYQSLIEPARPSSRLWRLALGIGLAGTIYVVLLMIWVTAEMMTGTQGMNSLGQTPYSAFSVLLSFACLYPGLYLALRLLHRRGFASLLGPRSALLRDAGRTLSAAAVVYMLLLLVPGPEDVSIRANQPPQRWLIWLLPAAGALLLQIAAEELTFRGYIQSQLAARFRSPLVWMILPSIGFGLLHYSPQQAGDNALWMILPPTLFGLVAADLTARTGNLGPALALHFLNNFAAIMILAPGDILSGLALWRIPIAPGDPAIVEQLPIDALMLFILWLATRLALRK